MNETRQIDAYLSGRAEPAEKLIMDARLLLDTGLQGRVQWQQHTYALVKAYGCQCLRQEIEAAHKRLFTERGFAGFRQKIRNIFKKEL